MSTQATTTARTAANGNDKPKRTRTAKALTVRSAALKIADLLEKLPSDQRGKALRPRQDVERGDVMGKPTEDYGDRTCFACGKEHGSVGVERHCMRRALREARADIEDLRLALSVANARPMK